MKLDMNIVDTLDLTDYNVRLKELEGKGRARGWDENLAKDWAKGWIKGRAMRDLEIALRTFTQKSIQRYMLTQMLQELDIPDKIIDAAWEKSEAGYTADAPKNSNPE